MFFMEKNKMVFQLNPLIETQKDFDVMETRLFYLGLQDINPHITENDKFYDEQFPDTNIPPSELTKIFGHTQYLTEIDKTTDRLIGRYVSIKFNNGFRKYTIFQHINYISNEGLYIKFNEDMRPFLLDIYKSYKKYGFTKIEMQQIFILDSSYAMRLLELLLQYRATAQNGIIEREIEIEELREKLNVPQNAYKGRMCNFRQFVLDNPIKNINKKTKYYIRYDLVKTGRKITAFKFYCDCNNARSDNDYTETIESQQAPELQASPAFDSNDTPAININENLMVKLSIYGFSNKTINHFIDICKTEEELEKRLNFAEKRAEEQGTEVEKISGYIKTAIEENWLAENTALEMAKRREIEAIETNREWEQIAMKMFSDEPAPECEEKPFDLNNISHKYIVNSISKKIKGSCREKFDFTEKNALKLHGLTVKRFIELYM